jgi:hypothetical protein
MKQQGLDYDHDPHTCHIAQCYVCRRERITVEDWTCELNEARASPAWALTNAIASKGLERI